MPQVQGFRLEQGRRSWGVVGVVVVVRKGENLRGSWPVAGKGGSGSVGDEFHQGNNQE